MLLVVLDMKTDVNPHSSKCLVRGGEVSAKLKRIVLNFSGYIKLIS
ncbi:Uncharacterised protein [Citrobacter freundii]|nr:Uncharacterised protein [Citrobacter freundii]